MKRLNLFVCAALAIAGAASCDPVAPEAKDSSLRISASYADAYMHGSQGWIEEDKLGMFAVSDGQTVASNVLYTPSKVNTLVESEYAPGYFMYNGTVGEVELLTNAGAIELPHGFNEIYLYTPYVEGLTDMTAVPLPDLSVQTYVENSTKPDLQYCAAYNKAATCDCGIVRMGEMIPVVKQLTIVSPTFPESFVGKKITGIKVASTSTYTKIAYKAATLDLTTGETAGEKVNEVELILPEAGLEIESGYFGAAASTVYVVLSDNVSVSTTFKFTFTVDNKDYVLEAQPHATMSSEYNLNMYNQLVVEEPSTEEEETPAE